ncbi:MAG TPA: tetratricopeptide repeat protein [Candidatus Eremiobacteraeota bacterium]|nr:MAG: Tetratricopeptide repeat protein [bacterium ADurb.Bin363]HPZ07251.1 tetratricopeptide repeat protein [Candidatus Eremiobacteraeota bacterium]
MDLHTQGNYSEAIKCCDKALQIDLNYELARKNREDAIKKLNE